MLLTRVSIAVLALCAGAAGAARPSIIPMEELLKRPVQWREELRGRHPRLFFSADAIPALRTRAAGADRELWGHALRNVPALVKAAPPPGSPELDVSKVQYNLGYGIAQAAFAYVIERDPKYLKAAKAWTLTVITYPDWGYTYRTPNIDLPPAHLLYGVSFAYDLLYNDFTAAEREVIRRKLVRQARLMYEAFQYKPGRTYAYTQNHSFIPMTGLAMAAFTLMDEEPEARSWAQLARAIYDRMLLAFDTDGYYYEGFHYAAFSLHWIVRYFDALKQNTGEDLYPAMRARFLPIKYQMAYSMLPDGSNVFDFGDTGRGTSERNTPGIEPVISGYEALYRLAEKYRDPESQGVADWVRSLGTVTYEDIWSFIAHDPAVPSAPVSKLPPYYYFADNGTVYWRSGWEKDATAIAFRCGPPEGHHVTALLPQIPEWRLSTGHAHPDANSFIVFAGGRYLSGDAGYTGKHGAIDHSTVLVNGRGQGNGSGRHDSFDGMPYAQLDRVRIADVRFEKDSFSVRGEAAAAYPASLKLARFSRTLQYNARDGILITDTLEAQEPVRFTWLLCAESAIEPIGPRQYSSRNGSAVLEVERVEPVNVKSEIQPRVVTSQGRPGSIEKGAPDQRGYVLIESTPGPVRTAEFVYALRWKQAVR